MRILACCLLLSVIGCASAEDGGGGFVPVPADLAGVRRPDLAVRPADLAMPPPPGADLAVVVMPDLAVLPVADLAGPGPDLRLADLASSMDLAAKPNDLAVRPDLATTPDLATPPDLATRPDLAMAPDLATPPDLVMAPACHILVNELMTGDQFSGSDEFVEFYNPCLNAIDLVGHSMVYRLGANATGPAAANDDATINFGATPNIFVVPGKGYLTACTRSYSLLTGACDASYMNATLANKVGGVGLRDPMGNLLDSVAYGAVAQGHAFVKTAPAPEAPYTFAGDSLGRLPNGVDTGNNSKDWKPTFLPTIDGANQ